MAENGPFHYSLTATSAIGPNNVISYSVHEDMTCGGAHGTSKRSAMSFDTTTGETINLLTRYHLTKVAALAAAVKAYPGPSECKSYLQSPPMQDAYDFESAALALNGLAISITFNAGAAESCGATPAIIPVTQVQYGTPEEHSFQDYSGTIGQIPIAVTFGIVNSKIIEGSHYYYRKFLKDIPLTGTASSEITLIDTSGGTFNLHPVDNANQPTTPDSSTGLVGTWTANGHTLPVKLSSESIGIFAPGHRYTRITNKTDAQFEMPIKGFYTAALANDPVAAARFVAFPLRINVGPGAYKKIPNATLFKQKWTQIFSVKWLKNLAKSSPHDLFTTNGYAMIGNGLAFFNEEGLSVVNK
ncbi:hypothetical protein [Neokomagataea tanensis]|nr:MULTISPECIES: hypothetical protein [Neokomagataea]